MTQLGIEVFINEKPWKHRLENCRIGFLGHFASVDSHLQSSLQLISLYTPLNITCVFGPQHGFKMIEQANMITTQSEKLSLHKLCSIVYPSVSMGDNECTTNKKIAKDNKVAKDIPIFSLYSDTTRRLTTDMLSYFDVLIVDLQDVGCRVYTYLSTLFYVMEDCHKAGKEVWILDRPNPVGRKVEGSILKKEFTSFVGVAPLPIRHGLTLGECAKWYYSKKQFNNKLEVITMKNYNPVKNPDFKGLAWVAPSPNMPDTQTARCYSGTVLLEGSILSEARGTTSPLKMFGFPDMDVKQVLQLMNKKAPHLLRGCVLREECFKPLFDKFKNQLCMGLRIYIDHPFYQAELFSPYRLICLFLKCFKEVHVEVDLWKPPPYEYEYKKLPIDILSGCDFLRHWVENNDATIQDLENKLQPDEKQWIAEIKPYLLYP